MAYNNMYEVRVAVGTHIRTYIFVYISYYNLVRSFHRSVQLQFAIYRYAR